MVMKIKLVVVVVVVVVVVACQKQKSTGGEQGAQLFVGIWVQHGVSQLNVTKTAILVTSSH